MAMEVTEKPTTKHIVPAPPQGLAVRSATLVARGLRDLVRNSNWLTTKVFTGHAPQASISSNGQVCAVAPHAKGEPHRIVLYDIERGAPALALAVPNEAMSFGSRLAASAAFAWSPSAQFLVAAWGLWEPSLHFFDLHSKMFLGAFSEFSAFPRCINWSGMGRYFALAGSGKKGSLELWTAGTNAMVLSGPALRKIGPPEWVAQQGIPQQAAGDEPCDEATFAGYGRIAFSPDERTLASAVEIEGEWADDSIAFVSLPGFQQQQVFPAQGHITDLTWTPDSRRVIYCAAGQAYRVNPETLDSEQLPFGAELCLCHPYKPLCVCFSSWLKNSAKGRLFLVDLDALDVYDEHPAENVVDLRWSIDGSKAYAVTRDGLAYSYEPPM
jgi:WD40 repeat protein